MRIVMFYHSLLSDWNHGNAHFLRGVASELISRGHELRIYEPRDGWSLNNLRTEQGELPIREFKQRYPGLESMQYELSSLDLDEALDGADLVIVHEWNDHSLVARIGEYRARSPRLRLLFHDTHHRAVTDPQSMATYDLRHYDGVLAFGKVLRDLYLERGWTCRAWTWHEAADTRVFRPMSETHEDGDGCVTQSAAGGSFPPPVLRGRVRVGASDMCAPPPQPSPGVPGEGDKDHLRWRHALHGDLIWVGNWGDEERTAELHEFLLEPVKSLGLRAKVFGVRYPDHARDALASAGIEYGGWLPNFRAPEVFAGYKVTVHVPRRPYTQALRGIPTIRVFEALACGIPLVSAPWDDVEGLFSPGEDYLIARDGAEMKRHLDMVIHDRSAASALAQHGRQTILARHTCRHRVDELLDIFAQIEPAKNTTTSRYACGTA